MTQGAAALDPIKATLRSMFGHRTPAGLAGDLVVSDALGWFPAATLVDGTRLRELLDAAKHRWRAAPHAAAALAWKAYTYWLALPVVLGWASTRRVPLVKPADVLVHIADHRPLLAVGLRPAIGVAVLPSDPLARSARPEVRVVADEAELLGSLRRSLLDEHLAPLLEQIRLGVRLGPRTLLGSLSSGVAYGILHAPASLPGSRAQNIGTLLTALGVADLIDLVPRPTGELTVQRKTCCLAFTLPEPKICSGCCIRPT